MKLTVDEYARLLGASSALTRVVADLTESRTSLFTSRASLDEYLLMVASCADAAAGALNEVMKATTLEDEA